MYFENVTLSENIESAPCYDIPNGGIIVERKQE